MTLKDTIGENPFLSAKNPQTIADFFIEIFSNLLLDEFLRRFLNDGKG